MKNKHIHLYILILFVVFILSSILQVFYKNAKVTQNTEVYVLYQLTSKEHNCLATTEQYYFFLPGCEQLLVGSVYSVVGRVIGESDSGIFAKKRLIIASIEQEEIKRYSVEYWRNIWIKRTTYLEQRLVLPIFTLLEENEAGVVLALLLGRKQLITPEVETLFKTTGTQHIVAISGYNFAIIVASLAQLLGKRLERRFRAAALIGAIAVFAGFVGDQPSVIRAALMSSGAVCSSLLVRRQYLPHVWICLAAIVMLLVKPTWLFEPGFQLSFIATASLIWGDLGQSGEFTQRLLGVLSNDSTLSRGASQVLSETFEAVWVGFWIFLWTAPITLLHFQQISLLGVLATASVAWLLPFISREGFAALLLASALIHVSWLVPVVHAGVQVILSIPIQVFLQILETLSQLQLLSWSELTVSGWVVMGWYCLLLIYLSLRRRIQLQSSTLALA